MTQTLAIREAVLERVSEQLSLPLPHELVEAIAERAAELVLERLAEREQGSPWLALDEATGYLPLSRRTLERLIAKGRIRSTTIGRRRLLHRDDLDALARAATGEEVAPTTPPRRRRGVG
jgi:excisionase family DNA binding protein